MTTIENWLKKEWPVKSHEGSIRIEFSNGRYIATVVYFVFDKNGRGQPKSDWAVGDEPDEAFTRLWQKAVLTIKELKDSNMLPPQLVDWTHRFLEDESVEDRP